MEPTDNHLDVEKLARELNRAFETCTPIEPFSTSTGLDSVPVAYQVQTRWTETRIAGGDRVLGHKVGLTSRAMQRQIGVDEPDHGRLWESGFLPARDGAVTVDVGRFLKPRIEGEFAFLIGRSLEGPTVTASEVLASTDAIAVSAELIDSRFTDWRVRLVDTIADNAAFGAFTLGPWSSDLPRVDLRTIGMLISRNGRVEAEATGSAVLGHPANSVAWLARRLGELGSGIRAGDVVLSGSLTHSLPVQAGDRFLIECHGQPPLTVAFG